jgi:hypothetical protein
MRTRADEEARDTRVISGAIAMQRAVAAPS